MGQKNSSASSADDRKVAAFRVDPSRSSASVVVFTHPQLCGEILSYVPLRPQLHCRYLSREVRQKIDHFIGEECAEVIGRHLRERENWKSFIGNPIIERGIEQSVSVDSRRDESDVDIQRCRWVLGCARNGNGADAVDAFSHRVEQLLWVDASLLLSRFDDEEDPGDSLGDSENTVPPPTNKLTATGRPCYLCPMRSFPEKMLTKGPHVVGQFLCGSLPIVTVGGDANMPVAERTSWPTSIVVTQKALQLATSPHNGQEIGQSFLNALTSRGLLFSLSRQDPCHFRSVPRSPPLEMIFSQDALPCVRSTSLDCAASRSSVRGS